MKTHEITFPEYSGIRCLMMPYIQGDAESVPEEYRVGYEEILSEVYFEEGGIGYLTIDESLATQGTPHRGRRAKSQRALHTEVGRSPDKLYTWGQGGGWGRAHNVELDGGVKVFLANNLDDSCALWDAEHPDTSLDGDLGHVAELYPLSDAVLMKAGEVHQIGVLTPHESLPVVESTNRQFLRIVSSGVHGREPYFTPNPTLDTYFKRSTK